MRAQPLVPWQGGKRRLAKHIIPRMPEHTCYVEPFAGAAAIFFMRPEAAKVEVLNDVNGDMVNLYRVVQHHLDEFVRQFRWALVSREMYKWAQLTDVRTLTDIQRAARFYYLQKMAFGGKATGQTFGTATTAAPRLNLLRIEEQLSAAHLRLSRVYIEHLDWAECIKKYDREHTLFYCDPPYWETTGYGVDFGWEQYEELRQAMQDCKGKVILSINDHPDIRELFSGFRMETLGIRYTVGAGEGKKAQELLIFNFAE